MASDGAPADEHSDGDDDSQAVELSEVEKSRIRAEMRYAQLVLANGSGKGASTGARIFQFASNAFVIAVVGAAFTYFVGPTLQHRYDEHRERHQIVRDCFLELAHFTTRPFEEFYTVAPLANRTRIDDQTFNEYSGKLASIRLRSYDADTKIQSLLATLEQVEGAPEVSRAAGAYAVEVRALSDLIDDWLNQLRCEPHCVNDPSGEMTVHERYDRMYQRLDEMEPKGREPLKMLLALGERV